MNNGTFGIQNVASRSLGVYRSPIEYVTTQSTTYRFPNAFGAASIAIPVLKYITAYTGFVAGDIAGNTGYGINSTANTVCGGIEKIDERVVNFRTGQEAAGWQSHMGMDGTLSYVPLANFKLGMYMLGPLSAATPGVSHIMPARHTRTRTRLLAASTNYIERHAYGLPPVIIPSMICLVGDLGYSPGNVVNMSSWDVSSSTRYSYRSTSTVAEIRSASTPSLPHRTTGANTTCTANAWGIFMNLFG